MDSYCRHLKIEFNDAIVWNVFPYVWLKCSFTTIRKVSLNVKRRLLLWSRFFFLGSSSYRTKYLSGGYKGCLMENPSLAPRPCVYNGGYLNVLVRHHNTP